MLVAGGGHMLSVRSPSILDFMELARDIATCIYHTGLDPFTVEEIYTAKHLRDRKLRRALLQFFKPENYFEVREALLKAGRPDLIGSGCDALIPPRPPKVAREARMEKANRALTEGRHVHQVPETNRPADSSPKPTNAGYRPARKAARRRPR